MYAAILGGCGGSTTGGIKIIRSLITLKQGNVEIKRLIHPHSVVPLKLGKHPLSANLVRAVWGFIAMFTFCAVIVTFLFLAQGLDIRSAIGAMVVSLGNAGAGIGTVAADFAALSNTTKWIMIVAMLAGRLEIFTLIVLLTPNFWRR